jgi:hypothetical protein
MSQCPSNHVVGKGWRQWLEAPGKAPQALRHEKAIISLFTSFPKVLGVTHRGVQYLDIMRDMLNQLIQIERF